MSGEGTADGAQFSGSSSGSTPSLSHLPWNMIPAFRPGETDVNEYAKKLEFLAGLWPQEHLAQLAPRAAMLCEGSAFKRVMRIETSKLKVNSTKGVELLVTSLGGIWGKSNLEEKFERFERAIYSTIQKADESHESYLARHDYQFEELLQMGVGIPEVRAYILLRNSGLNAEDKKRLIVDASGDLEYKKVVSSLKLLGSKFFQEVQSGSKPSFRTKTYDVNALMEDEPTWGSQDEDAALVGEAWDESELPYEGDPDALICMQFEDSILDALQAYPDLASCYNAYLDARRRLSDRTKNRGFWNGSKGSNNYPKGKGKGKGKSFGKYRKPLAQRIMESECRRCGQRGHWKAECPLNRSQPSAGAGSSKESGAFTGMTLVNHDDGDPDDMILIEPEAAVPCPSQVALRHEHVCMVDLKQIKITNDETVCMLSPALLDRFVGSVKHRLSPQPRTTVGRPNRSN